MLSVNSKLEHEQQKQIQSHTQFQLRGSLVSVLWRQQNVLGEI